MESNEKVVLNSQKQKEKEIVYYMMNPYTGEVVDALYEGDSVKRGDSRRPDVIYKYNKDERFVKLFDYTEELRQLLGSDATFSVAIRLSKFICYEDCILRMGGHGNGKILDVHDISELLKIPYNTLRKHMGILFKNGILANCKTGTKGKPDEIRSCIIVNPNVYMRGTNLNKTVKSIFENSGWDEYIRHTTRE